MPRYLLTYNLMEMSMKDTLWTIFAHWLGQHPRLIDWLIRRAQCKPHLHLHLTGYMERWWLLQPSRFLPFSIRVHHILRADNDRTPHNHPWVFRTIVLRAWYVEEVEILNGTSTKVVSVGETYERTIDQYHRIAAVPRGGVWTLFIMGNKTTQWGFKVDGRHVNRRDYRQSV